MKFHILFTLLISLSHALPSMTRYWADPWVHCDHLGTDVDIEGNYAIAGAPGCAGLLDYRGKIYVYQIPTFSNEIQIIQPSTIADDDAFGSTVDMDGDYIIGGAWNGNKAWIFKKNTGTNQWEENTALAPLDAFADWFGIDVSISGDYAIVGVSREKYQDTYTYSGGAYIYKLNPTSGIFEFHQKIYASDVAAQEYFGQHVEMDGDYAFISNNLSGGNGKVYVFKQSGGTWLEQQILIASDSAVSDGFGSSLSIDGNYAVIGAPNNDDAGTNSGSAYIFQLNTGNTQWSEQVKLTASNAATGDGFGTGVYIDGNLVIIGASGRSSNTGTAYIFERDTLADSWSQIEVLLPTGLSSGDRFGQLVAISGKNGIIGTPNMDEPTSNPGYATGAIWSLNGFFPPTPQPSKSPSRSPTKTPSKSPTKTPSETPSKTPSSSPSSSPSIETQGMTDFPTKYPSQSPTSDVFSGFEGCVNIEIFDGEGELTIDIDITNNRIIISIESPKDKWFGIGFGNTKMLNTYAYIASGSSFDVNERKLGNHEGGDVESSTSISISKSTVANKRYVAFVRGYKINARYDFTNFIQCNENLNIIWALGADLNFGLHLKKGTISVSSCLCPTTTEKEPEDNESNTSMIKLFGLFFVAITMIVL